MPGKRKIRTTGGQVKTQRVTTQTTLKDLFQKTHPGPSFTGEAQDLHYEYTDSVVVVPSPQAADLQSPAPLTQPSRPSGTVRLFPIFAKVSSVRERQLNTVINVDDTAVVDITDTSSEVELSTESPLSSVRHLSPCPEFSQVTSRSPPVSPTALTTHCCEGDTDLPHAGAHRHARIYISSKKNGLNRRALGLEDVGPLPSSCSQHVRGVQHSYNFGQVPVKRSVFSSPRSSIEGTLDFLTKGWQPGDTPSTPLNHVRRSLTPQQCKEYLQSLSRDYSESHPAFAQIPIHQERTPSRHTETWTRRFRPRRANEVLGNERHALYLRDWLKALELQFRDCQPEKSMLKGAMAREKGTLKPVKPRGAKRPRIIRAVARKRGSKRRRVNSDDDLDDFVVFSDTDEEQPDGPPEHSEDELEFCQRTLAQLYRHDAGDAHATYLYPTPIASGVPAAVANHTASPLREPTEINFGNDLTNALLITGPSGCGKTAAVYACAGELGWEVFEVYPGIGKRNGGNLDHLVGDVGRNHIVQTVHRRALMKTTTESEAKEPAGIRGYLAKSKMGQSNGNAKSEEVGTVGQPISVEADSPMPGSQLPPLNEHIVSTDDVAISGICHAGFDGSRPNVRQSLVLLEEVDILFKEDAGFWPAVVDFIRCCQRPVVMTCNDPGLVPCADLPLQAVLAFEPCPSPVAATFLQCLSLTEGCLVPHEDLMVLYETTHSIDGLDVPDAPLCPRTEPLPLPDLRRSITQLQMWCAGAKHGSTSEMHQGDEAKGHVRRSGRAISAECRITPMERIVERELWRQMKRHSELMSHVDAQLRRPGTAMREVVSMETMEGSVDEEMGYMVLSTAGGLQDEVIAEEAIRHSRGLHEEVATDPVEASINPAARLTNEDARWFRARVEYQSRMVDALQDIIGPPAPLVPQRSVFLDYIPWVRYMVTVDDILERRAWDGTGKGGSGRWTRNSMRTRHARMVGVSSRQQALLRGSRLDRGVDSGRPEQ